MVITFYGHLMMKALQQYIYHQPLSFMATLNGKHMYVICYVQSVCNYSCIIIFVALNL